MATSGLPMRQIRHVPRLKSTGRSASSSTKRHSAGAASVVFERLYRPQARSRKVTISREGISTGSETDRKSMRRLSFPFDARETAAAVSIRVVPALP